MISKLREFFEERESWLRIYGRFLKGNNENGCKAAAERLFNNEIEILKIVNIR